MNTEASAGSTAREDEQGHGGALDGKPIGHSITFVRFLKYFMWLLYVSRISLISAAVGVCIFLLTLQARDLFLEVRSNSWMERTYWSLFYFLLIFAWLLPVYFSAIYMIEWATRQSVTQTPLDAIAKTKTADVLRNLVPLLLVFACLSALGWAQHRAYTDFNGLLAAFQGERAQYGTLLPIPNILLLIQATMLAGVLFISSRATLAFEGKMTIRYFFYSIGMAIVVLLIWFIYFSPQNELIKAIPPRERTGFLTLSGLPILQWLRLCFPFFIALGWIFTYAGFYSLRNKIPDRQDLIFPTAVITLVAFCILLFVDPLWLTRYAERALLLPVVLGVWVPLFSILSVSSSRTGFPIVISFLIVIAIFGMTNNAHVFKAEDAASSEQVKLNEAIDTWKRLNGCADKADGDGCPALVLVGAQGGASRSAYFTSSVLGNILDENGVDSVKRIFAMSGVSGGSVGFAFFSAAISDRDKTKTESPCRPLSALKAEFGRSTYYNRSGFINWFGASRYFVEKEGWLSRSFGLSDYGDDKLTSYNQSWRNCFQVLAAGDFLSPVFLRLSGADFIGFNRVLANVDRDLGADRATVLENAWEQHYQRITGHNTLTHKFLDFAPKLSSADEWKPLLLFNATSTTTGRRVIASHLYPWYCDGNGWKRRVFNDAYDLHEIFSATGDDYESNDCKCARSSVDKPYVLQCKHSRPKYDFTLSKAASLSARFPVISPQADLKARDAGEKVLARVVDGGYFENHGATSLFDLVTAIKWLQKKLPIHVILITNDPTFEYADCLEGKTSSEGDRPNPLPVAANYQFWSGFRSILGAGLSTRGARGSNAAINLCKLQWTFDYISFTHIGVRSPNSKIDTKSSGNKTIQDISMSWWSSYPIQLYLDSQIGEKTPLGPESVVPENTQAVEENKRGFGNIRGIIQKAPRS